MTPEDLLNLVAKRAALSNLQDEDHLNEIDRQIVNAAPDIARDLIETRLTLAAEQGRVEGAPSEGWTHHGGFFERWEKGKAIVQLLNGWRWRVGRRKFREASSARAGMIAADAAMKVKTQ